MPQEGPRFIKSNAAFPLQSVLCSSQSSLTGGHRVAVSGGCVLDHRAACDTLVPALTCRDMEGSWGLQRSPCFPEMKTFPSPH